MLMGKNIRLILLLVILASLALAGCSTGDSEYEEMKMAAITDMPAEVQSAPVAVQQAYQFAVANPDVLTEIPCYCGCGAMGHTSNYACYVAGINDDGSVQYDNHALGCSICVDITIDTMRLMKEGKDVPEIRSYIDSTYAQYGPSNMP